jgi:hypothetical protein
MQLRPRHYILLAVIVGLFIYNIVRHRHDERNAISNIPAPILIATPRLQTPAWAAFDHAASLRDAPDSDYQAALKGLNQLLPLDPNQTDGHIADIKGCLTWLEFYRQGMAQTHADPQMKIRSSHHLDTCVKYHLDTSA